MNFPNQLTLSRIFMIPIFVGLMEATFIVESNATKTALFTAAALIYLIAAITDLIDGALARKWNMVTDFGKLFDPLADKLLVTAALIIFVQCRLFHGWVVVVILSREFIVTGLRSLGERHGRTIAADQWGKMKTVFQTVTIVTCLVYLIIFHSPADFPTWAEMYGSGVTFNGICLILIDVMMTLTVILTVASGFTYMRANWDLLRGH